MRDRWGERFMREEAKQERRKEKAGGRGNK